MSSRRRLGGHAGLFTRLMAMSTVLVVLSVAVGILTTLSVTSRLTQLAVATEVDSTMDAFGQALAAQTSRAETLAVTLATNPAGRDAFAARDRDALLTMLAPGFETLSTEYGVEQLQFHVPPATSFLRVHKPEKFGDDLSSFRATVVEANATKQVVSGVEGGVAGLGLRAVVPVSSDDGAHLGTVEYGLSVDQGFLDSFHEAFGVDGVLWVPGEDGALAPAASTLATVPELPATQLEDVFAGVDAQVDLDLDGAAHVLALRPLLDYSGAAVGVVGFAVDTSGMLAAAADARALGLTAGAAVLVVGLALSVLTAAAIGRSISRPVARMGALLQAVADGDFTQRAPTDGSAEIAAMARALNTTLDAVSHTLRTLGAASARLTGSSEGMSEVCASMSSSAQETSQRADVASSTTDQVSTNIAVVAAAAEEMGASIAEIAASAASAAEVARRALERTESTTGTVASLNASSVQIGEAVKTITTIAEQTNLLALNATIESARVGEAGKGFAVVAGEVKELAQQTSQFTEEIGRRIEAIQADSRAVVAAIADIADIVGQVNDLQGAIASAVEQQHATTSEISRSAASAADGAQEITRTVERVAQTSQSGAAATRRAQAEIADLADQLDALVRAFVVADERQDDLERV